MDFSILRVKFHLVGKVSEAEAGCPRAPDWQKDRLAPLIVQDHKSDLLSELVLDVL